MASTTAASASWKKPATGKFAQAFPRDFTKHRFQGYFGDDPPTSVIGKEQFVHVSANLPLHAQLEKALRGLGIIIKAVNFYPTGHPALTQTLTRHHEEIAAVLQGAQLHLQIQKDRFLREGHPVAPANPALVKLAHLFFVRRMEEILFLPDLTRNDLENFARILTLEPEEIRRRHGLPALLREAAVLTIWVNEKDFSRIAATRREITADRSRPAHAALPQDNREANEKAQKEERQFGATGAARPRPRLPALDAQNEESIEAQKLNALLDELEREQIDDEHFCRLAREIAPLIHLEAANEQTGELLRALALLGSISQNTESSAKRREAATGTLRQIGTREMLDFLTGKLASSGVNPQISQRVQNLLPFLGEPAAHYVADRLAEEDDARARKRLARTLVRFERAALPALSRLLKDERWYVVRNAVAILGEIRDPERISQLAVLMAHDDLRVRREAVRALTRIGSDDAMEVLLVAMEEGDKDLQRQSLLFLGAFKQQAAIPHLLAILAHPDPFLRRGDLVRGAVHALGEIGNAQAQPALAALLARRRLWRRRRFDEIRAAAAEALGKIAIPQSRQVLERAAENGPEKVTRAANRALRELAADEDGGRNTSG